MIWRRLSTIVYVAGFAILLTATMRTIVNEGDFSENLVQAGLYTMGLAALFMVRRPRRPTLTDSSDRLTIYTTLNGVEGRDGVPSVSGGDVRLIQILKRIARSADVILSVGPMGRALCERYGLRVDYRHLPVADNPGVVGNLARVLKSVLTIPREHVDVVYSSGEHLYDVLPAALIRFTRGTPWYALVHWVENVPWKDVRGGTPSLHRYLYWLNRVFAMWLIRAGATKILGVSQITRDKLERDRGIAPFRLETVLCGLDLPFAMSIRTLTVTKTYDAVFMKRLNYGKGVLDLIDIWKQVTTARPSARLQIIGDGPLGVTDLIRERIVSLGLSENIELVGVVHDPDEKRQRLAASRLFILPSHEENWAIVIGEALAAGLPVTAYDLKEITGIWGERVWWIPFGNTASFADAVLAQLESPPVVELDNFLRSLDWDAIADREYALLCDAVAPRR